MLPLLLLLSRVLPLPCYRLCHWQPPSPPRPFPSPVSLSVSAKRRVRTRLPPQKLGFSRRGGWLGECIGGFPPLGSQPPPRSEGASLTCLERSGKLRRGLFLDCRQAERSGRLSKLWLRLGGEGRSWKPCSPPSCGPRLVGAPPPLGSSPFRVTGALASSFAPQLFPQPLSPTSSSGKGAADFIGLRALQAGAGSGGLALLS